MTDGGLSDHEDSLHDDDSISLSSGALSDHEEANFEEESRDAGRDSPRPSEEFYTATLWNASGFSSGTAARDASVSAANVSEVATGSSLVPPRKEKKKKRLDKKEAEERRHRHEARREARKRRELARLQLELMQLLPKLMSYNPAVATDEQLQKETQLVLDGEEQKEGKDERPVEDGEARGRDEAHERVDKLEDERKVKKSGSKRKGSSKKKKGSSRKDRQEALMQVKESKGDDDGGPQLNGKQREEEKSSPSLAHANEQADSKIVAERGVEDKKTTQDNTSTVSSPSAPSSEKKKQKSKKKDSKKSAKEVVEEMLKRRVQKKVREAKQSGVGNDGGSSESDKEAESVSPTTKRRAFFFRSTSFAIRSSAQASPSLLSTPSSASPPTARCVRSTRGQRGRFAERSNPICSLQGDDN